MTERVASEAEAVAALEDQVIAVRCAHAILVDHLGNVRARLERREISDRDFEKQLVMIDNLHAAAETLDGLLSGLRSGDL